MNTAPYRISCLIFAITLLSATGCASIFNKVDKDAVREVKKVALVGFTYDQQLANSGKTLLDNLTGKNDSMGGMGGKLVEIEASPHINEASFITERMIKSKLGWTVLDRAKTIQNAEVKRFYDKKNATIQAGAASHLQAHFYRYEATGLPQFYYLQFAEKAELNEMAKSLGVDALVLVKASTRLSQTSVMGIGVGSVSSVTDVAFFVYDPKRSDFVVVFNASGDESQTKESKFAGFADSNEMNLQALESYQSGLTKALAEI